MAIELRAPVVGLRPVHRWRTSELNRRLLRTPRVERTALIFLLVLAAVLVVVPWLVPHDPTATVGPSEAAPSADHLLGTDEQGRDLFSRSLVGMRTSWFSALLVVGIGLVVGGLVGLLAGVRGGWVDTLLMRVTDLFLALPGTLLVLAVVAAMGPSLRNTLIAVSVVWWPWYARVVRGEVRSVMSRPYVKAARMGDISTRRLVTKHVLPGSVGPVMVTASLDVGALILMLAALSFLGLGSPPPAPELGSMTARGLTYLLSDSWWIVVVPATAVFVLSFLSNLAGDAVRDLVED
jgi:peptide/nickel transport system permease protein